jgi:hypothetical protein
MKTITLMGLALSISLASSAWCAGPELTPSQIQNAIREGSKYKTADNVFEHSKGQGKRVQLASAMAADGISKYATFFNDRLFVVAQSAAANQQMRELKATDVESKGLLHAFVEITARGSHGTGKLDRRFGNDRAHLVLKIGDRIVQPVEKNMNYRSGQSDLMYVLGANSGRITLIYAFDVSPQDLQSQVEVILIDGDGHRHEHEANLSGVLDIDQD